MDVRGPPGRSVLSWFSLWGADDKQRYDEAGSKKEREEHLGVGVTEALFDDDELSDASQQPTLLLVDDDETFCKVLEDALHRRGFEVHAATDVDAGIALAESIEPEYAVIDLRIGQESGLVLVKRLHELDANTRIVMLTGFASIATAVEAIKLGAVHYLAKPADAEEIVAALHKHEGDEFVEIKDKPLSVRRLEWEHLQKVLVEHGGNISAAARALGMHRRSLQRKLEKRPVKD